MGSNKKPCNRNFYTEEFSYLVKKNNKYWSSVWIWFPVLTKLRTMYSNLNQADDLWEWCGGRSHRNCYGSSASSHFKPFTNLLRCDIFGHFDSKACWTSPLPNKLKGNVDVLVHPRPRPSTSHSFSSFDTDDASVSHQSMFFHKQPRPFPGNWKCTTH